MDITPYEQFVLDAANKAIEILDARKAENPEPEKPSLDSHIQTFTVAEAAKITNRNITTIRNHIKAGLMIAKKGGKNWIITHENLNNYIGNQKIKNDK